MTSKPCPHLEKELPSMEQGLNRHVLRYVPDIDMIKHDDSPTPPSAKKVRDFIKKMSQLGLMEHQIQVLLERFVFNKTFKEITEEHGYTNTKITFYIYKQALDQIKRVIAKTKAKVQ